MQLAYIGTAGFYSELVEGQRIIARERYDTIQVAGTVADTLLASGEWDEPDADQDRRAMIEDAHRTQQAMIRDEAGRRRDSWTDFWPGRRDTLAAGLERLRLRLTAATYGGVYVPPPPTVQGGPKILLAWVQYTGSPHYVADILTTHFSTHIDATTAQVLIVPYETALYLVQHDTRWTAITIAPDPPLTFTTQSNGLTTFYGACGGLFGVNANGTPYFDSEGVQGNEGWKLYYNAGNAYLAN